MQLYSGSISTIVEFAIHTEKNSKNLCHYVSATKMIMKIHTTLFNVLLRGRYILTLGSFAHLQ